MENHGSIGITVWGECISFMLRSLTSCCPRHLPLASWKRTHSAISRALELMDPAGATLSMLCQGIATAVSPTRACGEATLGSVPKALVLLLLRVMPSGSKIRWRMTMSHDLPVSRSIIMPEARNMWLL